MPTATKCTQINCVNTTAHASGLCPTCRLEAKNEAEMLARYANARTKALKEMAEAPERKARTLDKLAMLLKTMAPAGLAPHHLAEALAELEAGKTDRLPTHLLLTWGEHLAWACEASISINRNHSSRSGEGGVDIERVRYGVQVNWSSTHRSVAQAVAALSIYEAVTRFAALVEAAIGGEELVAYAVDREAPKAAAVGGGAA